MNPEVQQALNIVYSALRRTPLIMDEMEDVKKAFNRLAQELAPKPQTVEKPSHVE
jgi:HAMP domain-containing protein